MKRILFLILWLIPVLQPQAHGDIEIFANGHKYDSLQAYQVSKRSPALPLSPAQVSLSSQQEEYIRQEAQKLGFNVDFSKVKTFQVDQKRTTDIALHKLYVLSVENGVVDSLQDFYQTWGQSSISMPRIISSEQLQEAIQEAVATSKAPKFLISEPGKVRIMAISAGNS